jgi:DNA modification methylase
MPARSGRIHEHQTPPELVRRLVSLLTVPNDLVADPFAGSGQVLRIARDLGRRSVGSECDQRRYERAAAALLGNRSRGFRAAGRKVSG